MEGTELRDDWSIVMRRRRSLYSAPGWSGRVAGSRCDPDPPGSGRDTCRLAPNISRIRLAHDERGNAHRLPLARDFPTPARRRGPDASPPASGNRRAPRMESAPGTRLRRSKNGTIIELHRRAGQPDCGEPTGSTPRSLNRARPVSQLSVWFEPGQFWRGVNSPVEDSATRRSADSWLAHAGTGSSSLRQGHIKATRIATARLAAPTPTETRVTLVLYWTMTGRTAAASATAPSPHLRSGPDTERLATISSCGPSVKFRIAMAIPTLIRTPSDTSTPPATSDETGEVSRHRRKRHHDASQSDWNSMSVRNEPYLCDGNVESRRQHHFAQGRYQDECGPEQTELWTRTSHAAEWAASSRTRRCRRADVSGRRAAR